MRRGLAVLGAWVLLTAAGAAPQWLLTRSVVLAVVVGLLALAGWSALMLSAAVNLRTGLIASGLGVVVVSLMHFIGTADFQAALLLSEGRALEGVTLAEVLAKREAGLWVSLSDARVRSEATKEVIIVTGAARDSNGKTQVQQRTTHAFAPVTLASDVSQELTTSRVPPSGRITLWACAPSSGTLRDWDTERQAVRGTLAPIEPDLLAALTTQLQPTMPAFIPGAGAIPAAPGASDLQPTLPAAVARLELDANAWCVHLARELTAAQARDNAVSSALVFIFSIPFFTVLFACVVALTKGKD